MGGALNFGSISKSEDLTFRSIMGTYSVVSKLPSSKKSDPLLGVT